MSTTEQTYALLVAANPVPDPDALPEAPAIGVPRLRVIDSRRSDMEIRPDEAITDEATGPARRRRSAWVYAVAACTVALVAGAVIWMLLPDGREAASPPRDEPPWGLTGIEMPDTEAEVIAVIEAMPAIDGYQPLVLEPGGFIWGGVAYGMDPVADDPDPPAVFSAMPTTEPGESWALRIVELAEQLEAPPEPGATGVPEPQTLIEARSFDPTTGLMWYAATDLDTYQISWTTPEGTWLFSVWADSAELRTALVQAFVTAAGE